MNGAYDHWSYEDVEWTVANKFNRSSADTSQSVALCTILVSLILKPLHEVRKDIENKLSKAKECGCTDCEEELKEYTWFLEISQHLEGKEEIA